jgi:hypothetical protein
VLPAHNDPSVQLEWAHAWAAPQSLAVDSPDDLKRVLTDIHAQASRDGVATAVVIHHGDASFSIVVGLGAVCFLQWMGGANGAYLGVDTGVAKGAVSDVVAFSYLGHYSEVPRRDCVPYVDAIDEAKYFLATGGLSPRWEWSGHLGETPAPEGARIRDP